ncbi:MAG: carboxymuconolactone decarboxylase family protein [Sedimentisphaerales bacterium]|nr:carboxymuconolactone decarboxylase family protein [Sedimentisphaerales bacterium]
MNETQEYFSKFKLAINKMKAEIPETTQGFAGLYGKVMKDGALTVREKELIALGIGIAMRCEPCIRGHVQNCLDAGADRQQILEAASVAVMMAGGPAYTYIPLVLDTLDDLQKTSSDKT